MHISMPFSVQQYSSLFYTETWITAHSCSLLYKIFCKKNYCTRCLKPCKQWVSGNAWDLKTVLWHKNPGHLHCILCKHFYPYGSSHNVLPVFYLHCHNALPAHILMPVFLDTYEYITCFKNTCPV